MDIKIGAVFSLAPDFDSFDADPECNEDNGVRRSQTASFEQENRLLDNNTDFDDRSSDHNAANHPVAQTNAGQGLSHREVKLEHIPFPTLENIKTEERMLTEDDILDESTDSAVSVDFDSDTPPSLQMESSVSVLRSLFFDFNNENMPPPVLQPVSQADHSLLNSSSTSLGAERFPVNPSVRRNKCTRIDPSYIVLTDINPFIQPNSSVSYRRFKHMFRECTNMCKKHHFKRRLDAGKDVFNVKTPSKQRDYQYYLWNEESNRKVCPNAVKSRKQPQQFKLTDLLQKLDSKIARSNNDNRNRSKKTVSRVRRSITRVPKDFVDRLAIKQEQEFEKQKTREEKETLVREHEEEKLKVQHERELQRLHRRELNDLKCQIYFKRTSNKQFKNLKKATDESTPIYIKSGTSSISGRVRKTTSKYASGDFAVSNSQVATYRSVNMIRERLHRENSKIKMKKLREEKEKKHELMNQSKLDLSFLQRKLKRKSFDVVIDNAEECEEKKLKLGEQNISSEDHSGQSRVSQAMPQIVKDSIKSRRRGKYKQKREINDLGMKSLGTKSVFGPKSWSRKVKHSSSKRSKDGVLIKEMPSGGNLLAGLLQNVPFEGRAPSSHSLEVQGYTSMEPETDTGDKYALAKSLLKQSLDKQEVPPPVGLKLRSNEDKNNSNRLITESDIARMVKKAEMEQEKNKQFKIPDVVQNLFKIKPEPLEELAPSGKTEKYIALGLADGSYTRLLIKTDQPRPIIQQTIPISTAGASTPFSAIKDKLAASRSFQPGTYTISTPDSSAVFTKPPPPYSEAIKVKFTPPILKSSTPPVVVQRNHVNQVQTTPSSVAMHSILKVTSSPTALSTGKTILWQSPKTTTKTSPALSTFLSPTFPTTLSSQANLLMPQSVVPLTTKITFPLRNGTHTIPTRPAMQRSATSSQFSTSTSGTITSVVPVSESARLRPSLSTKQSAFEKPILPIQHVGTVKIPSSNPSSATIKSASSQLVQLAQSVGQTPLAIPNPINCQNMSLPQVPTKVTDGSTTGWLIGGQSGAENTTERSKFYLIRVDGKNILIPVQGEQAQPRAYVVNNENTTSAIPDLLPSNSASNVTVQSPVVAPVPLKKAIHPKKPTAAITPSMKSVSNASNMQRVNVSQCSSISVTSKGVVVNYPPKLLQLNASNADKCGRAGSEAKVKSPVSNSSSAAVQGHDRKPVSNYLKRYEDFISDSTTHITKQMHTIIKPTTPTENTSLDDQRVDGSRIASNDSVTPEMGGAEERPLIRETDRAKVANPSQVSDTTVNNDSQNNETKDKLQDKPKAFSEGISARQERLQKLKALQMEKQKAVEVIRLNRGQNM